ncbi:UNVERIFIED_CONTAM: hypothetical protein Slati_3086400 [Sesamum latifolium]|uniref:RNase H type-1 domain-containing protein n=1 Tax=Sesamum latifolium TaxID=2727402 RepID=A0AAW2UUN7_9LAMI
MENVHRFMRLEQSMPQTFLPTTTNRSTRGFHIRLRIAQHDGCFTRIPSDPPEDRKKVSFITSEGTFYYVAMPFGLKNVGATYQRLVDKIFHPQIGRNVEVLKEVQVEAQPSQMRFRNTRRSFLGIHDDQRGIEANPLKIKAIIDMKAPTCLNEAQTLIERIAALSRCISKSAEKSLPFFKMLRKAKTFEWGTPCQLAFEELKANLARLPLLVKPSPGETLYLYLSVAPQAISSVLIWEEDEKQLPIYYMGKVLGGAEGRYTPIEKIALALVVTARRTTIKAEALADFVSEMAEMTIKDASQDQKWLLHVDGSSTAQGSGVGIVITTPQGEDLEFAIKFGFKASNNEAKYEALVIGMRKSHETGAKHLLEYLDSQLVVKQVEGTYEAKEESMIQYLQQIANLKIKFYHFQIIQIPREENAKVDSLSKLASSLEDCRTRHITIHYLPEARTPLAVQLITTGEDWRTPIIKWIEEGLLPKNRWEAARLKTRATRS